MCKYLFIKNDFFLTISSAKIMMMCGDLAETGPAPMAIMYSSRMGELIRASNTRIGFNPRECQPIFFHSSYLKKKQQQILYI